MDSKTLLEILTHLSCALTFFSFVVKEILWLRVLAIASSVVWIAGMVACHQVILASVFWNAIGIAVNLWHIAVLLHENHLVNFTSEEKTLYQRVFSRLKPGEFRRLLALGKWENFEPGRQLVTDAEVPHHLWVLTKGETEVRTHQGTVKARLGEFDLIGEMSFLTHAEASGHVVVVSPTRGFVWAREALQGLLETRPELKLAFDSVISLNLVSKLQR
jgi:hypothetical protein